MTARSVIVAVQDMSCQTGLTTISGLYKVTMVVLDKLSIQGRYGCYIGPE